MTDKSCIYAECGRPVKARGLCNGHYGQARRGVRLRPIKHMPTRNQNDFDRLYSRVERRGDGCILFLGTRNELGYGRLATSRGRQYAHRESWRLANGEIPDGLVINHTCGVPSCIAPDHLEAVTQQQNTEYRVALSANNTSGYRGVAKSPTAGKWVARMRRSGADVHIGTFNSPEEALSALPREEFHRGGGVWENN